MPPPPQLLKLLRDVVAEGIETAEQQAIVDELGIGFVQGFYVATPCPLEELVA
ncbi:MAG: hypothetical protein DMF56_14560 [Acidobacteria bacterium]|nr:MAG: hypothetical protein DMF56_14560 [Acidobacteriota bacterium]